ncbi:lysophospholipid acyltransferase family protein [Sphingobacterium rhinopitheci]|uniref:lysophospholipid acyltransferase family protein n=1 Tax=Sphingobacterium rhinopitheci TaxID=2781960 RepID=UPI001F529981|nr:lysophospholipid acyltransferase family protein [Sphingobacterium rhinopitheci]
MTILAAYSVGIKFKIEYESDIDWSKNYVICPNHTSLLDITAVTYLCKQPISFIGKSELLHNPVTRTFFKTIDIAVDRSSRVSAFKAFKQADKALKEGKSLVIFPEGKIDDEFPPRLHEFKSGSFRLALDNEVQLLPVVIVDAWKILWDDGKKFGSRPGTVHIKVLKPITTKNLSAVELASLQERVFTQMQYHWKTPNK